MKPMDNEIYRRQIPSRSWSSIKAYAALFTVQVVMLWLFFMPPFPTLLDSPLFVSVFSIMFFCVLCLLYNQAGRIVMGIAFAYSYVQRPD
ncbi:hypothetical protein BDV27DRAFT_38415 [Aspergillus caelatus]|uniref:Uncharacterized protein n=1 Tax=Aspergillus caelatus TaxID=61420 RepID=A0A5N6ZTP7_9EURO|nr:uncharacterized protein BDV27DRAFT_38415 [Aspergillus caelatus]KAE8360623.1 hypothetical protein BDV27DRAFT_38415 [Aspergillus caelatus]